MSTRTDRQLIFAAFMGACAFACVEIAIDDWKAMAAAWEEGRCNDEPDRVAYFARKPKENHNVEQCIKIARFGDPKWVPDLGIVTVAGQGIRGKPGLEKQLSYVRAECRRLAKQLKQRC